ncbi:lymphocyte antigen 6 complex locus protein G5b [Ochotona princeps]|uniref:lymphocyte antigen 6 complex locus protein G5b n=1 Tax=Ochotona princeps TaxID=9978 RepID=UPI00271463BF|nr:lymphocyte antigen 6 complex locus protein G5b [Ochotona princeps]
MMEVHALVGVLIIVDLVAGKAPVPEVRACHFCLLEDPAVGCISGSEKCTISTSSLCMVITIHYNNKARFNIRGCGQHNSYRCKEKRSTYLSNYWYEVQCCPYDYCNSWTSPQLESSTTEHHDRARPLSDFQIQQFYQALNLSLPQPGLPAGKEPDDLDLLPPNVDMSIADLRHIYLFLNSSGLVVLPRAGP